MPLTYEVLGSKLKEWVKKLGHDPSTYTLHGLRGGEGSNFVLTIGLVGKDLHLMGDWVSMAYMEYIDLTLDRRVKTIVKFVDEMDNTVEEVLALECESQCDF